MKRLYKIFTSWFICLFLVLSLSITSFADVNDLMIGSSSNAVSTFALPRSSIANVSNTVNFSGTVLSIRNGNEVVGLVYPDSSGNFSFIVPDGKSADRMVLFYYPMNMPKIGKYRSQFDFSSHSSLEYVDASLSMRWSSKNVQYEGSSENIFRYMDQLSGDMYLDFVLDVTSNLDYFSYTFRFESVPAGGAIGGTFSQNFARTTASADITTPGVADSDLDYQQGVSSSLSDLSSSVGEVSDEIGFVAEAIQNLQGAMEPHYSNVLTQLHHITEQLHAFYDQVYNNIHLPELSMLTQIKEAIENIDLQIEVDISEVKTAINNMSTAVQNKLQSTTDQITGGYDNAGITQENEKLEQSIDQYDEVESGIFEDAEGFIGDFEYPSVDSLPLGIIKALAFVGSFLQGVFICMSDFSVIITFSLTMIFVMVVVGYHRIRS